MTRFIEQTFSDLGGTKRLAIDEVAQQYFPNTPQNIVPLAISLALITESADETALIAANVGGDSDSVASIGGAIAGSLCPERCGGLARCPSIARLKRKVHFASADKESARGWFVVLIRPRFECHGLRAQRTYHHFLFVRPWSYSEADGLFEQCCRPSGVWPCVRAFGVRQRVVGEPPDLIHNVPPKRAEIGGISI